MRYFWQRKSAAQVLICALALSVPVAGQQILYVDINADPTRLATADREGSLSGGKGGRLFGGAAGLRPAADGTSWFNAFYDLADALAVAGPGDEIWIAAGRYTPDRGTGDRRISFKVPNGVQLYGGFGGWEWLRAQRDWTVRETILSGDLNGDDEHVNCADFSDCCVEHKKPGCDDDACEQIVCSIWPPCCESDPDELVNWRSNCTNLARTECCDLGPGSSCDNSIAIVDADSTDSSTIFDGLVIAGAFWSSWRDEEVRPFGGVFAQNSAAVFRNCVLRDNQAFAAIVSIEGEGVTIERTLFQDNGPKGLWARQSKPTLTDCTFIRHVEGAAVRDGVLWVTNSVFRENSTAVVAVDSSVRVENCDFFDNALGVQLVFEGSVGNIRDSRFIDNGAAVNAFYGFAVLRNLEIRGSSGLVASSAAVGLVSNCLIAGQGREWGIDFGGGSLIVENSTIIDKLDFGILVKSGTSAVTIRNSILWGNRPSYAGRTEDAQLQILLNSSYNKPLVTIENSIIEGWTGKLGGNGNSGLDPMFLDRIGPDGIPRTGDGDYRLDPASPGIDAGTNAIHDLSFDYDLNRHPRVLCGTIDIGPYELGVGDLDCSDTVDLFDFAAWNPCMSGPLADPLVASCAPFDFNADDLVDLADFAGFQNVFQGP